MEYIKEYPVLGAIFLIAFAILCYTLYYQAESMYYEHLANKEVRRLQDEIERLWVLERNTQYKDEAVACRKRIRELDLTIQEIYKEMY